MFDSYTRIFERRARAYQDAMARRPDARRAEFAAVLAPLGDAPGRICDMPAGGGYLAGYLDAATRYLAIEPTALFLAACRADERCERVQAPIDAVPLGDGCVDHVVSLAGLHHEERLLPIFREMRRLIRAGGRVVIADVAVATGPARFLNGYVAANCPQGHDGRFLDGATAATLAAAGLHVREDRLVETPWRFDGRADAGRFCGDLFGLVGPGPGDVAAALADQIGFDETEAGVALRWTLRRIVCEASALPLAPGVC